MTEIAFTRGTVALITGGGGGIGAATGLRFLQAGADIALVDVTDGVHRAADDLRAQFPDRRIAAFIADVSDESALQRLRAEVVSELGGVDHLALVAGVVQEAAAVEELAVEEWDRIFSINARGVFLGAKTFIPLVKERRGTITAISSFWARTTPPFFAAYAASKTVVVSLVKTMAGELGPDGVRVNAVAPGQINTAMHRGALTDEARKRGISFEEMRDIEWGKVPLGIAAEAEVIADAVVFLSSPAASYVTGATLDVNGGVAFH